MRPEPEYTDWRVAVLECARTKDGHGCEIERPSILSLAPENDVLGRSKGPRKPADVLLGTRVLVCHKHPLWFDEQRNASGRAVLAWDFDDMAWALDLKHGSSTFRRNEIGSGRWGEAHRSLTARHKRVALAALEDLVTTVYGPMEWSTVLDILADRQRGHEQDENERLNRARARHSAVTSGVAETALQVGRAWSRLDWPNPDNEGIA